MHKKILIVDDYDDLSTALTAEFAKSGHAVKRAQSRDEAVALIESEKFDMIITDLDGEHLTSIESPESNDITCLPEVDPAAAADPRSNIKAFKICVSDYKNETFDEAELKSLVEITLNHKTRFVDQREEVQNKREKIEFEIPSFISLMHTILDYLLKRVEKVGVVNSENSNLFIALDEAFVNAVKHGNKFNAEKMVRIAADVSTKEARFTIEDEGDGFDVSAVPDPCDPENLFKTSGRGVLIIHNVMDEVKYNERGNRLTMVKKSEKNERV